MKVHHIALRSNDIERAEVFWTAIFGLRVLRREGARAVWLALDGAVLMLERAEPSEALPAPGGRDFLALSVSDEEREKFRARCRERSVPIEHETEFTTYVRDPDGRRVGVSSYRLEHTLSAR